MNVKTNPTLTLTNGQTIEIGGGFIAFCWNDNVISIARSVGGVPALCEPAPLAEKAADQPVENHRHLRRMVSRLPTEPGVAFQGLRTLKTCWAIVDDSGKYYIPGGPWTSNPSEARLFKRGQAEWHANRIQSRGGPHRRCRVVRLDQRAGEFVRIAMRPRI